MSDDRDDSSAQREVSPNQVCPVCGAENIASAVRCLSCHARLVGAQPPTQGPQLRDDEIFRLSDEPGMEKIGRRATAARDNGWFKPLMRGMGILGIFWSVIFAFQTGTPEGLGFIVILFLVFGAVFGLAAGQSPTRGAYAGMIADRLVIGAGCLTSTAILLVASVIAYLFIVCATTR